MTSQIMGLRVAGTLFGLMGLAQLGRLVFRPDVMVSGHEFPLWPSVIALVVLGTMSAWMFAVSCKCTHGRKAGVTDSP